MVQWLQVAAYIAYVEENRITDPATSVLQSKTKVKTSSAPGPADVGTKSPPEAATGAESSITTGEEADALH